METFYGILVAIAFSIVIMIFQKKKKQKVWTGIVKKIVSPVRDLTRAEMELAAGYMHKIF